jgi:small-conductance mechanosensitive channel
MNPQNNQDWERKLKDLEIEINPDTSPNSENPDSPSRKLEVALTRLRDWFNSLPTPVRVVVAIFAVMTAFSLLTTVLQAIASLISTIILVLVLYVLYRTFLAPRSSK